MLESSKVMAFVATTDAPRARRFYEGQLGLTVTADDPFAIVLDANGTRVRVQKVPSVPEAQYTILGWEVPDIRARVDALGAKGVTFERVKSLPQDERGIWTAPDGTQVAWFRDPDRNLLSLTQF